MKKLLFILIAVLVGMSILSCRTIKYVPVESVRTDSIYLNKLIRDSIYVMDSVYVHDKGDTVIQYKYKYIYKDVSVHDTTYIERIDSIRVPYPIEAQLTKWERIKMKIGGITIVVMIVLLITGFIYWRKKR